MGTDSQVVDWVHGWVIPEEVGTYPMGAVVPRGDDSRPLEESTFARTAARTWHTLIIRSRPRAVVLIDARPHRALHTPGRRQLQMRIRTTVSVARELVPQLLESNVGLDSIDLPPSGSALATQLLFLGALAPGCPVLPIFLGDDDDHEAAADFGERLGQELLLDPDVLIVAISDLTRYGESYGFCPAGLGDSAHRWLRQNDARMIGQVRELAAQDIVRESREQRNASAPHCIAAAVAAARVRGSTQGHLLEYTTSHQASSGQTPFQAGIGYGGIVF